MYALRACMPSIEAEKLQSFDPLFLAVPIPVQVIIDRLPIKIVSELITTHNLPRGLLKAKVADVCLKIKSHEQQGCTPCESYTCVFVKLDIKKQNNSGNTKDIPVTYQKKLTSHFGRPALKLKPGCLAPFPPEKNTRNHLENIAYSFCRATDPCALQEVGCMICGMLVRKQDAVKKEEAKVDFNILCDNGLKVACQERWDTNQPRQEIQGPITDNSCSYLCMDCLKLLRRRKIPLLSLANGNWIGNVPTQLSDLSYAEKLLIARVRPNYCVVRVESGMHKMHANAVLVPNPTAKIYEKLPPHRDDLDNVMAFVYTGPTHPTQVDLRRTPFLVRRRKITAALEWLKLNHCDYFDLDISEDNLNSYKEEEIPVTIEYHKRDTNKYPLSTSIDDTEEEMGTNQGDCSFIVHGLIEEQLKIEDREAMIAEAIRHMEMGGKSLGIGHAKKPSSLYSNPQLYPQAFPWLFPYGRGGVGNNKGFHVVPPAHRLRQLLMYHDKRFQRDGAFILIAFNHTQIKSSTTSGFLLTKKANFPMIVERLMSLDKVVLKDLASRLRKGDHIRPGSQNEIQCYQLIKDLDHISGRVEGSGTTRKFMNNEAWSLVNYIGAPTWYITFAPADEKHPIALYYADGDETYYPKLRTADERHMLIANNPVGSARFFHVIVEAFLKHVLKVGKEEAGLWGKTKGYYGTVEQQGRLTLHLHMLLWIENAPTPQKIREQLLCQDSDFQKRLINYLEDLHTGDFLNANKDVVKDNLDERERDADYQKPTLTLPVTPPGCSCELCEQGGACTIKTTWWEQFTSTVNDLIFRNNRHTCRTNWCLKNKWKKCKARFPRPLVPYTSVDKTGHINIKKSESMINTYNPILTYLLRCNTDVTSLLSGTSIKAVIAYVTDYVTKSPLKTYNIFETICDVFDRNTVIINGDDDREEKARSLLVKIVNGLTTKMQIGSPMAASYLLGLPDHYTSHTFKPCHWRPFVSEVLNCWPDTNNIKESNHQTEKVILRKINGQYVTFSAVSDYTCRPVCLEQMNLYDWFRLCEKRKINNTGRYDEPVEFKSNEFENDITDSETIDIPTHPEDPHDPTQDFKNKCTENDGTSKALRFLPDHPQHDKYRVDLLSEDQANVPNFLGGPLPRKDNGNQEYYFATMITLFKPWRHGSDVKKTGQTWQHTFETHEFTPHELEVMNHFNIRYECLDARDDYHAQMKAGNDDENASVDFFEGSDEMDVEKTVMEQLETLVDVDTFAEELERPSMRTIRRMEDAEKTQHRMEEAGWYCGKPIPTIPGETISEQVITSKTRNQWRQFLEDQRRNLINKEKATDPVKTSDMGHGHPHFIENDVRIIDHGKQNDGGNPCSTSGDLVADISRMFSLRPEQDRAFKIIATHALKPQENQLKMYLGGMAGTGKSQVIKALKCFFLHKNEAHRLEITAPTGSAAALIDGSTYHSLLGFQEHDDGKSSPATLSKVKTRLRHCEYFLLDEVSMLSCQNLYDISKRLSLAMDKPEEPFGGINVILCGDFAQLPPVRAKALYNMELGSRNTVVSSTKEQECTIGKALWHQFTTVVILRENMRQRSQSVEDQKYRKALENMRYKDCTEADIQLLESLISSGDPGQRKLEDAKFRHISVITSRNRYRDCINETGALKYATETGQNLIGLYSLDALTHSGVRV